MAFRRSTQNRDTGRRRVTDRRTYGKWEHDLPSKYGHLKDETDAGLLLFVALREEDGDLARESGAEFYRRHYENLYRHCARAYMDLFGEGWVVDLVQDTFEKAYIRAETFTDGELNTPEDIHLRARSWLHAIARNCVVTRQRRTQGYFEDIDDESVHSTDKEVSAREVETVPSPRALKLEAALESLSERERDVLRVTFHHHRAGEKHQRLPNDVARDLAATWDTTPENLRQIRRRALNKVKAYVDAVEVHDNGV
ncbi:MAG: sigma-70 family RNA polymerase sigma factor [Myxococcota bacterium]